MKKCVLFFLVVIMVVVKLQATTITMVDQVPWPQYFTDIKFDPNTGVLSYWDEYRPGEQFHRKHIIEFYYRNTEDPVTKILKVDMGGYITYTYGWKKNDWSYEETVIKDEDNKRVENKGTTYYGGKFYTDIRKQIAQCVAAGYTQLHVVIKGKEKISDQAGYQTYETTLNRGRYYGAHLNNYIDIDIDVDKFNTLSLSGNQEVEYGEDLVLEGVIQGFGNTIYRLQRSDDNLSWQTVETGNISKAEARAGKNIIFTISFKENGFTSKYYRLLAQDVNNGFQEATQSMLVKYLYNCTYDGETYKREAGEIFTLSKPKDCIYYKIISDFPVQRKNTGDYIEFTQPACNVEIQEGVQLYMVKFLDKDFNQLKLDIVECGSDATPPQVPEIEGYSFREWSGDITNVHKDMSVIALYDMGEDYSFNYYMSEHKNERYHVDGFLGDEHRAMLGDSIEFAAEVRTPAKSTLYYEVAMRDSEGEWQWTSGATVGVFTDEDAEKSESITFKKKVAVAYDYGNEMAFRNGFAFRFRLNSAGTTLYSEPYEFEVYYPITIKSQIEQGDGTKESLYVENPDGDAVTGAECLIPARYKDIIRIIRPNNNVGACLNFVRVNKPSISLNDGVDDDGSAWLECPGETEVIDVSVSKKVVWFSGTKETQAYDFSQEGLGKYQHAYYAEVVNCGSSISKIPQDPTWENRIFLGWKNDSWDEYADNAYLNVPAIDGIQLEFTAQWDDLPEPVYYTVNFYQKDGKTLIESKKVLEGDNAVPPDDSKIPNIAGYHFVGWDKNFNVVTKDLDIIALYGEDGKEWTVTYLNWDDEVLGTETVQDGCAAIANMTPMRENYAFVGWDKDLSHVYSDIVAKAQFSNESFTVTFRVDGVVAYTTQTSYGQDASTLYPYGIPEKKPTTTIVYIFKGWSPEPGIVTSDITFDAVFEEGIRTYKVIFQNWDHKEIETQQVEYGKAAKNPVQPTRSGYTFTGWDRDFDNIIADIVVTAQFKKNKGSSPEPDEPTPTYVVKLTTDGHGSIEVKETDINLKSVPKNTVLHLTAIPDNGYDFKRWADGNTKNPRMVTIIDDITYTAEFEPIQDSLNDLYNQSASSVRKMIIDGQVLILKDNDVYNVLGEKIKSKE